MSVTGDPKLLAEEFQQVPAGNPNGGATERGWRSETAKAETSDLQQRLSLSDEPSAVPTEATARVYCSRPRGLSQPPPPGLAAHLPLVSLPLGRA